MPKRFTDTGKWNDKWFRALSPAHKLAWGYLCDCCDVAGVIDLDRELANFQIGLDVDWDAFLNAAGHRIESVVKGKLWLVGFIPFQYGQLSDECRPHKPVASLLEKYGLWKRYQKGIHTLKDKDQGKAQDKDQEQDKEKAQEERGSGGKPSHFDTFWAAVPNRIGKRAAAKAYEIAARAIRSRSAETGPGADDPHAFLLERITAFAASPKAQGKFCPHPATWLNEGRYDDDERTWQDGRNDPRGTFSAAQEYLNGN